ncbi:MAG TPA: Hsp20/alpha crystallin family protein [Planctomycetaceae bacterium]|nr:Hsp20/alpha crystallin family protein [Planctomycetaceae bacterium]
MAIFRWGHSWDAFHDLEREVDRLLQSVNMTFQGLRFGRQYPPVNLYELSEEYLIMAEVPGVRSEDLELTITNGVLSMKGRNADPVGAAEERFRRQERPRGVWQRSISIPDRVNVESLSAEFTDGILKIHLPKAEETKPRQIPVAFGT